VVGLPDRTDRQPREIDVWWAVARATAGTAARTLFRIRATGVGNLPSTGGALLAFNHVSVLDFIFVGLPVVDRGRIVRFLGLSEDFERPLKGWAITKLRHIPVRRGMGDWAALDDIARVVAEGWIGAIAPEGTVGDGTGLQRGHKGAARIALLARAPIIPVGVWGTQRRWPKDGLRWGRPLRPVVGVAYGPPIDPNGDVKHRPDVQALTDRIMTGIGTQVDRARRLAEHPR
jgi:1-acyl-sn-glycerol-3-phosphate acyltransferase